MQLTKEQVLSDIAALPAPYKTADIDRLIRSYANERADSSMLRPYVLSHQELHRIYFYVALRQIKDVNMRMAFIHENLLFEDWWHTDQLISYVADLPFDIALKYAEAYVQADDPFIRRWGYVMFISRLGHGHATELLPLLHDDEHYYSQMAQAWLIAELAVFEPEYVLSWLSSCELKYSITGKAIQKICDSFRITTEWKQEFKRLRPMLKEMSSERKILTMRDRIDLNQTFVCCNTKLYSAPR